MVDPAAGTGHRFNPPPGWPVPPAGWMPPPGWEPDPSWPPAPPGWQLWVPVGYGSASPPPKKVGSRFSLGVKILAGVITFAATVVGTYIAVTDRPKPYTIDDWARKANAVCEKDFGS